MKQLIVMAASVLLGIFLFNLIAGSSESSVYSSVKRLWVKEIEVHSIQDGRAGI
ncbi:MAG: hypothetical protein IJM17_09725 [Firmicutes bacterium]|nr:hypothetical protein [Bacillota bacterium]